MMKISFYHRPAYKAGLHHSIARTNSLDAFTDGWRFALVSFLAIAMLIVFTSTVAADDEVYFDKEAYKKLNSFEAHVLGKADAAYGKDKFKESAAEYDAFIAEFPQSKAVAYALVRKGRSLQRMNKRFEAMREYQEVVDYFPNETAYAGPAMYFIGQCHWQNGDEDKAVKTWLKMAEDKDYAKSPLAASALNQLAGYLDERDRQQEAVKYYQQVAVNFRKINSDAARYAIGKVIYYYIRLNPNEDKFREFYREVQGFDRNPQKLPDDLENDWDYWNGIRWRVMHRDYNRFHDAQKQQRQNFFSYWGNSLSGRFEKSDDYQIDLAWIKLQANGDESAWQQALDAQFARGDTKDFDRIIRWIRLFKGHDDQQQKYYEKINFEQMSAEQIIHLVEALYETTENADRARNALRKIPWAKISDKEKASLAYFLRRHEPEQVEYVCSQFTDKMFGKHELLKFYHDQDNVEKGLPLADEVAKSPDRANDALRIKAELFEVAKRWDEAIATWRQVDDEPHSSFQVAKCQERKGQWKQAAATLKQVEAFFKNQKDFGPRAAYEVAKVYERADEKKLRIAALRAVVQQYGKTSQASRAHEELEALGVRIGGEFDQ